MIVSRRNFLRTSACAIGAGFLPRHSARATASNSSITVLLEETVGTISPDLYGYLLENLGTVIYDGIWVGDHSKILNVKGIRKAVIDRLRDIKASVIRWPGGNFADYYDWQDGTGPRARRPRRTNSWSNFMPPGAPSGPQRYDPNQFGTPEFLRLCKLSGGRPFLNVNTRSLTPQSFSQWVEYCNSPHGSTTLADLRNSDGAIEPYGVRYWGIGNEVWGYGGNMSVEEYATLYKRFTLNVPNYDVDLAFVACGAPPGRSTEWVREFLRICRSTLFPTRVFAISLHYYATFFGNDLKPGETLQDLDNEAATKLLLDAGTFGPAEWYRTMDSSARIEDMIDAHWVAMGQVDERHRVKIAVDEWGAVYKNTSRRNVLDFRGRDVTLRDAIAAALTLNIFNRQCNRVCLANFTGLINQEGGLLQADGEQFCTTPVYHVFRMYTGHQGGRALRTVFEVPTFSPEHSEGSASLSRISGSASLRANELTLTVVNPHISEPHEALIGIRGGEALSAAVTTLTHSDIHAQNTFDDPEQVRPILTDLRVNGSEFHYTFPAASVTCLTISLKGHDV